MARRARRSVSLWFVVEQKISRAVLNKTRENARKNIILLLLLILLIILIILVLLHFFFHKKNIKKKKRRLNDFSLPKSSRASSLLRGHDA